MLSIGTEYSVLHSGETRRGLRLAPSPTPLSVPTTNVKASSHESDAGKAAAIRMLRDMDCPIPARFAWPQIITTNGVWPLLREQHCTHQNLEAPRLLRSDGIGRVVVDVGLGMDAIESLTALNNGFNVLGIEPLAANVVALRRRYEKDSRVVFLPSGTPLPDVKQQIDRLQDGDPKLLILEAAAGSYDGQLSFVDLETPSYASAYSAGKNVNVSVYRLQTLLQNLSSVFMLKIDVQGYELRVLEGVEVDKIQYIQFEFSPWLMRRDGTIGTPATLLSYLPSRNMVCFDTMGTHNQLPRPSTPLSEYLRVLDGGTNSANFPDRPMPRTDAFGPWEDITCTHL